jgi:hypothetical protein
MVVKIYLVAIPETDIGKFPDHGASVPESFIYNFNALVIYAKNE